MKTELDIIEDVYSILVKSSLAKAVTGTICKRGIRPARSTNEDIIIKVLASELGQKQEAFVNVNIYVADDTIDGQSEMKFLRAKEIARMAMDYLTLKRIAGARITLAEQHIYDSPSTNEHIVNNKLLYQFVNE